MKKLFLLFGICLSLFFQGCISTIEEEHHETFRQDSIIFSSSFNDVHYIWEDLIFPNNKTSGK